MLDAALQHRDGRLQLVGLGLTALHLKAQAVGLQVFVSHLLRKLLGGGVGLLLGDLDLLLPADGFLVVGLQLDVVGPDALQGVQPDGDLQPPQLVPEDQKFFRLLTLLPQGLYLQFKL